MAGTELFEIRVSGSPDRRELDRLRKLLNLHPRGRLDDIEDAEFGHRYLRDTPGEGVTLSLWRRTNGDWTINLGYRGEPPPVDLVDRVCAESVEAVTAMDTVHTALGLRREHGGDSGAERGWREAWKRARPAPPKAPAWPVKSV